MNTEELPAKLRLEANAWLMVASKMRNKVYLRNLEQRYFDQYTEYLLGEKCYNMKVPTASGEKSALQPPWHILLDYEHEMRSNAVKKSRKEGIMLGVALMRATQDAELKELHFTSPITFASMQRPAKVGRWEAATTPGASSGAWSSTGKGSGNKGKGKGKKGKPSKAFQTTYLPGTKLELATHTPDGQEICYRFNMKGKKCDGNVAASTFAGSKAVASHTRLRNIRRWLTKAQQQWKAGCRDGTFAGGSATAGSSSFTSITSTT